MTQTRVMVVGALESKASDWQAILSSPEFLVTQCQAGLDALSKLSYTEVDVVISSSTLDDLDVYQFCALIKSNASTRALPFILVGDPARLDHDLALPLAGPDA